MSLEATAVSQQPRDRIPQGVFFAGEFTPERVSAINRAKALGAELAESHPEVADIYRQAANPSRYIDIALEIIPDIAEAYPEVAKKAVGYAVRSLISSEEQAQLTSTHRAHLLKERQNADREKFLENQRKASARRHELHGVDVAAMTRGRGLVPWGEEEKELLRSVLLDDPDYKHEKGQWTGHPDKAKIASALNEIYHEGQPVRRAKTVQDFLAKPKSRKK